MRSRKSQDVKLCQRWRCCVAARGGGGGEVGDLLLRLLSLPILSSLLSSSHLISYFCTSFRSGREKGVWNNVNISVEYNAGDVIIMPRTGLCFVCQCQGRLHPPPPPFVPELRASEVTEVALPQLHAHTHTRADVHERTHMHTHSRRYSFPSVISSQNKKRVTFVRSRLKRIQFSQ